MKKIQTAYAENVGIGKVGIFSNKMKEIISIVEKFHADRSATILIDGETGTGKEIIARMIHYGKGDVTTPFIPINCSELLRPINL